MSNEKQLAEVLEWVNRIRGERNLPPLDRMPRANAVGARSLNCPIAVATGFVVGTSYAWPPEKTEAAIRLPDVVQNFIVDYDDGRYPDLRS